MFSNRHSILYCSNIYGTVSDIIGVRIDSKYIMAIIYGFIFCQEGIFNGLY